MLGNVANFFACDTLDVGKKQASVAVGLGNRTSPRGTRSVGQASSIRTMLESIPSVLAVTCTPQVHSYATVMVAVTEADAILFGAAKVVDRLKVWVSQRQALHDRTTKFDAMNPQGDNITETSLGVGVDTLHKTM